MKLSSLILTGCLMACGAQDGNDPVVLTGENLTITGKAALEGCSDNCPDTADPALSYQTPSAMRMGVARVEILRSADDANPHTVFESALAKDVDLIAGATFAQVDTGSIPEGVYTHMRVKLDWIIYTVDATGHSSGYHIPGTLDVDYALSDHNDAALGARGQGDYLASFSTFGTQMVSQAGNEPVEFPPSYPGAAVDTSNNAYYVTFPTPDYPIVIDPDVPESVNVDVTYYIEDAFGWLDVTETAFVDGVFDLSADITTEAPTSLAISGFSMDVCDPASPEGC